MNYNEDVKTMMKEANAKACDIALSFGVSERTLHAWLNDGGMTNAQKDACYMAIQERARK